MWLSALRPLLLSEGFLVTQTNLWLVALVTFVVFVILQATLYTLLYRRPRLDEALIRSGIGGPRVAVGTGLLVFPIVHGIKRVPLHEMSHVYTFTLDERLRWKDGEPFAGRIHITTQVPAGDHQLIIAAGRNVRHPEDQQAITEMLEPAMRSTVRDSLRNLEHSAYSHEPAAVEVRLTRGLDLATQAFGFRVRAVHMVELVNNTRAMPSPLDGKPSEA